MKLLIRDGMGEARQATGGALSDQGLEKRGQTPP